MGAEGTTVLGETQFRQTTAAGSCLWPKTPEVGSEEGQCTQVGKNR